MMLRAFRELDLFRKLPPEHREANEAPASGPAAAFSAISLLVIAVLTLSEVSSFMTPVRKQRFDVDMYGSVDAGAPRKVRVLLNVTVHDFPCVDLSLDYQDIMGTRAVDVKTTIFKQRLHKNGTFVGDIVQNNPKTSVDGSGATNPSISKNNTGNTTCKTCYGALPDGECCNTCSDVLYAYRLKRWALPRIESIEQCKHDGTAKSAYQPPQIIRLDDYSSDDYLPKFSQLGSSLPSGSEARISTPFRWNLTFEPLKPLTASFGGKTFTPLAFNFSSSYKGFGFSDEDSDLDDEAGKAKPWSECVLRNIIVHGYDLGEALMIDLSKHGAKAGCWNDDCTETDKFQCETMERCAEVCHEVAACKWWTYGNEDGDAKCWIRTGRHGRESRFGFSSGSRECRPNATGAGESKSSSAAEPSSTPAPAPPSDGSPQVRKLISWEDEDTYGRSSYLTNLGRTLHMPVFGMDTAESRMRKEQRGESCQIHGYFDTNKVPGNFHIGTHGATAPSYLSYWDEPAPPSQNMVHTINKLAFVEVGTEVLLNETQPLDGFESPKAFTFQYYLTITPATVRSLSGSSRDGYQFRAGSFVTNELIGPAVFFRMDIDPIRVTYYTEEVRWTRFVVNFCAVVGGCIAITSMLAQCAESATACANHKD